MSLWVASFHALTNATPEGVMSHFALTKLLLVERNIFRTILPRSSMFRCDSSVLSLNSCCFISISSSFAFVVVIKLFNSSLDNSKFFSNSTFESVNDVISATINFACLKFLLATAFFFCPSKVGIFDSIESSELLYSSIFASILIFCCSDN